ARDDRRDPHPRDRAAAGLASNPRYAMSAVTATASTETSCQPLCTDEDEAPCVTSGVMRSAKSTVVPCDGQGPAASHGLATEQAPTLTGTSGGVRGGRQVVGNRPGDDLGPESAGMSRVHGRRASPGHRW